MECVQQPRRDEVPPVHRSAPQPGCGGAGRDRSELGVVQGPCLWYDKGPVELLTDGQGNEWLINRRNGFKYPVEDGIPIMLLEEGEKHKDNSLIAG